MDSQNGRRATIEDVCWFGFGSAQLQFSLSHHLVLAPWKQPVWSHQKSVKLLYYNIIYNISSTYSIILLSHWICYLGISFRNEFFQVWLSDLRSQMVGRDLIACDLGLCLRKPRGHHEARGFHGALCVRPDSTLAKDVVKKRFFLPNKS